MARRDHRPRRASSADGPLLIAHSFRVFLFWVFAELPGSCVVALGAPGPAWGCAWPWREIVIDTILYFARRKDTTHDTTRRWRMGVKRGNSPRAFNWFGLRSSELHFTLPLIASARCHGARARSRLCAVDWSVWSADAYASVSVLVASYTALDLSSLSSLSLSGLQPGGPRPAACAPTMHMILDAIALSLRLSPSLPLALTHVGHMNKGGPTPPVQQTD